MNMKFNVQKHTTSFCVLAALALLCSPLHAQVPQVISYQGRIVVGQTNFNGTGYFKFALVNAAGTTTYWKNDGTVTSGIPGVSVSLAVTNGLFSVLLGDTSIGNMAAIPKLTVFNNPDVRLRVWFDDGAHGTQMLSPDQRIVSVGYAFMAASMGDFSTGAVAFTNGNKINIQAPGGIKLQTGANSEVTFTTSLSAGDRVLGIGANIIDATIADLDVNDVNINSGAHVNFSSGGQVSDAANAGVSIGGSGGMVIVQGSSIISADNTASLFFGTGALQVQPELDVFGRFTVGTTTSTALVVTSGGSLSCNSIDVQGVNISGGNIHASGDIYAGAFHTNSDRNLKEKFTPIDSRQVLERIASLPISSWNFKTDARTRHIGPMAQDFYAAFNVGMDDKHIATVDESGVAFAAIQGLNEIVQEQNAELVAKAKKIDALEKRLDDIEKTLKQTPSNEVK